MTSAAVFFDRDGVLNEIVWRDGKPASPRLMDELALTDGVIPLLETLKSEGFKLFVVTNQPDISRGKMSVDDLSLIHLYIQQQLPIDAIAVCTHDNSANCHCRKPKPGLVTALARDFEIDMEQAWLVGDQDRDITCAKAAGCRSILLSRSYNSSTDADHTVSTLAEAVGIIRKMSGFALGEPL